MITKIINFLNNFDAAIPVIGIAMPIGYAAMNLFSHIKSKNKRVIFGVMNIMLVSVVERTREIGVRIATGARQRDIMIQFNIEAAVVCTIGGIIGVILGFSAAFILSLFDVDILYSAMPPVIAFTCAVGTGVLFGYLPARKAAHLDPVVALSSE